MSERLLHSSKNPAARRLLEAGLRDTPPKSALPAVAAGLGAAVSLAPAASAAASLATGSAVAGKLASTGVVAIAAKWFAVGVVVTGAVSVGQRTLAPRQRPDQGEVSSSAAPSALTARIRRQGPESQLTAELAASTERSEGTERVERAEGERAEGEREPSLVEAAPETIKPARRSEVMSPRLRAAPVSAGPATVGADGALARETAWIDQARRALFAGNNGEAARALAAYESSKRVGVLDREGLLLQVELAVAEGNGERARALAERYRTTYPGDAHLPRLQALLSRATPAR
jgi:hypothetical protein